MIVPTKNPVRSAAGAKAAEILAWLETTGD
jgi:hypothetical protein